MQLKNINEFKTQDEARQYAIEWQTWTSKHELSQYEVNEWGIFFEDLANNFGLYDEFHENGIL